MVGSLAQETLLRSYDVNSFMAKLPFEGKIEFGEQRKIKFGLQRRAARYHKKLVFPPRSLLS